MISSTKHNHIHAEARQGQGKDEQDDQQAQNTITYILRQGMSKERISKMITRKHNHIHSGARQKEDQPHTSFEIDYVPSDVL